MTSKSLEGEAPKTSVPPLLQDAAAQLTAAETLRVDTTCPGVTVKGSAYFSKSSLSELHPTCPGVSSEAHQKRNADVLDISEGFLPSTLPATQNSEGVEIENRTQHFNDAPNCLDVNKVLTKPLLLSYIYFAKDALLMGCLCVADGCSDFWDFKFPDRVLRCSRYSVSGMR